MTQEPHMQIEDRKRYTLTEDHQDGRGAPLRAGETVVARRPFDVLAPGRPFTGPVVDGNGLVLVTDSRSCWRRVPAAKLAEHRARRLPEGVRIRVTPSGRAF